MDQFLGGGITPFATSTTFLGSGQPFSETIALYAQTPPSFWRVDARVEKRWQLSPTASVSIALEWLNATLNREREIICRSSLSDPTARCHESLRPLLSVPSVTLEGRI